MIKTSHPRIVEHIFIQALKREQNFPLLPGSMTSCQFICLWFFT